MKLLVDEMYPPALAESLRAQGIEAVSVVERGMAGWSDAELFAAGVDQGYAILTENVSDFARLAADHLTAGAHHPGVLVALSSRFSRRPSGIPKIFQAVLDVAHEELEDRLVYLQRPSP